MTPGTGLPGWERLRHGGLLLDGTRLEAVSRHGNAPVPLDAYTEGKLRQRAGAMLDGAKVVSRNEPIRALPNLGRVSERMLARAGIVSAGALRRIGPVEAFLRVEEAGGRPSLNLLYALEGALGGRHWTHISRTERSRFLTELEALRGQRKLG